MLENKIKKIITGHSTVKPTIIKLKKNDPAFNSSLKYRQLIKERIKPLPGVYFFRNYSTQEILYIGMAGKILQSGSLGKQKLQGRLLATRNSIDKVQEISTHKFIKLIMNQNHIDSIEIIIIYTKQSIPASYLEALLLYEYYSYNNVLPKYNKKF